MKVKHKTVEVTPSIKRPYNRPRLTEYGDVRDITLQASGEGTFQNPLSMPDSPRYKRNP